MGVQILLSPLELLLLAHSLNFSSVKWALKTTMVPISLESCCE